MKNMFLGLLLLVSFLSSIGSMMPGVESLSNLTVSRSSGTYDQYINTSATLRVAIRSSPESLNPVITSWGEDWSILQYIFCPLVIPNPLDYFNVKADLPLVAENFEFTQINNASGYWTIHLRRNLTFFDGVPVTAYDLNFTYWFIRWLGDNNDQWFFVYYLLNHTEVLDNYTVRAYVNIGGIVGAWDVLDIVVFPRHIYERAETWSTANLTFVGTFPNWNVTYDAILNYNVSSPNDPILTGYGPFKLVSWFPTSAELPSKATAFLMERNPRYFMRGVDDAGNIVVPWEKWSDMTPSNVDLHGPYVKYLQISVISDLDAIKKALLNSNIDLVEDMELGEYADTLVANGFTIMRADRLGFGHILVNTKRYYPNAGNISLLSRSEFRRALAYAFSKYNVCHSVWDDWAQPLDVPVPRTMGDWSIEYTGEAPGSYYTHNKEAALAELEKLGIKDYDGDGWLEWNASDPDSEITIIITRGDDPTAKAIVDILVRDLKDIGIHADQEIWTPWIDLCTQEWELFFFGFSLSRIPIFMEYFASWGWISYYGGWHNSTYDELIRDAFYVQTNWTKIKEEVRRAEIIYWYEQPLIPIYQNIIVGAYYEWDGNKGVVGVISIPGASVDNYYTYIHAIKPKLGAPPYSEWSSSSSSNSTNSRNMLAGLFFGYVPYVTVIVLLVFAVVVLIKGKQSS